MQLSNHGELIAVMAELWTLLDTLAVVEPGALRLPPPDTGYHPTSAFHADAALAAGFHPEAAAVMSALPYIHTEDWDPFELEGSTFPMSYLHSDEGGFAISREMFSDDNIMPPSALRLTWQDVNGWDYIYDTEKSQSTLSIFPTQMCLSYTANVAASNRARVYLEQHQRPLPGLPALTPGTASRSFPAADRQLPQSASSGGTGNHICRDRPELGPNTAGVRDFSATRSGIQLVEGHVWTSGPLPRVWMGCQRRRTNGFSPRGVRRKTHQVS